MATPLKGEVSSEMLYLLHTRSGMFQLTKKGWCSNSGPVVWGREGGRNGPGLGEAATSGRDVEVLGGGMGEALARGGCNVSEVKCDNAAERDDVGAGEGSLCEGVSGGEEGGNVFGRKVELDGGNTLAA